MGRALLLIVGFVVALGLGGLQQANQPGGQQQAKAASAVSPRPPQPTPPPRADPQMEDPGCQRGQDDRGSDLCAQWKAADAARASADAAWILGIAGLLIGGLTLYAASRAAHWAKAAAVETKRSADIAEYATSPQLTIKKAADPDSGLFWPEGEGQTRDTVGVDVRNVGATAAHGTTYSFVVSIRDPNTDWQYRIEGEAMEGPRTLGPQGSETFTIRLEGLMEMLQAHVKATYPEVIQDEMWAVIRGPLFDCHLTARGVYTCLSGEWETVTDIEWQADPRSGYHLMYERVFTLTNAVIRRVTTVARKVEAE